jgi:hypothetical protein
VLGREATTTATFRNTHVQSSIYLCFSPNPPPLHKLAQFSTRSNADVARNDGNIVVVVVVVVVVTD